MLPSGFGEASRASGSPLAQTVDFGWGRSPPEDPIDDSSLARVMLPVLPSWKGCYAMRSG